MQPHMQQSSLVTDAAQDGLVKTTTRTRTHLPLGSRGSHVFQNTLAEYGMHSSMSRKANCWDNVPIESLWGSLKVGRLYGVRFETCR